MGDSQSRAVAPVERPVTDGHSAPGQRSHERRSTTPPESPPVRCCDIVIDEDSRVRLGPGTVQTWPVGHLLYFEGAEATALYEVESGSVAFFVTTGNGSELDACTRGAGVVVGLESLLMDHYLTSARVTSPAVLRRFDAADGRRELERNPTRLWSVCRQFLAEIAALRSMIVELAGHTAVERLARYLLDEAAAGGGREVRLPWGAKGQLAHHLAISQETLSRLLHLLDRQGIVRLHHGGLEIAMPIRLKALIR